MTSDSDMFTSPDETMSIARRWVVRLRSGEVTQRDLQELTQWRSASQENRRAFALAKAQWGLLKQVATNLGSGSAQRSSGRTGAVLTRRAWIGGAMAASLGGAVYLATRPPLELWPSLAELNADYRTDVGERRQIDLASNVSIEMNTRTSLTSVSRENGVQELKLVSGEIAVRTGSADRPFVIEAGEGRISAAQAAFNLRSDGENISVACLEGIVQVECGGTNASLSSGQGVAYSRSGIGRVIVADGRAVEAWRRGLLVFENQPLERVVAEINRYRRGRIVLIGERIGRLPLDATFRLDRIEDAVPKIAHLFDLKMRTLPGGVVLLS